MDSALKVFRSQSTRRERLTQPCTLPMSPSMFPNDLSLPYIDQSFCRLSPEPLRSITPSTKSTSPLNTELSPFKSQLPLDLPIVTAKAWKTCSPSFFHCLRHALFKMTYHSSWLSTLSLTAILPLLFSSLYHGTQCRLVQSSLAKSLLPLVHQARASVNLR